VWVVAAPAAAERAARVGSLWSALGARPTLVDAERHDHDMTLMSHLPQLTANLLASVLGDAGISAPDLGPGGRDMTRLAASSPEMWRDILALAPPELTGALRALAARAEEVAALVDEGRTDALEELMRRTCAWRRG
jgi:prephenate dehydrogenase